jgi:hypothetical protein
MLKKTKPPLSKKLIAFGRVIHQDTQTVSDYSQKPLPDTHHAHIQPKHDASRQYR